MVNVLMLEELLKLIRSKGRAIVGVDSAGGPYWGIKCSFGERERADLDVTLKRKGYLLKRSQMRRYSLPL